jgi:retron-type reverse transcriptase
MGLEQRGRADQGHSEANPQGEEPGKRPEPKVKSFEIDKRLIVQAWEKVRANNGAPGVDAIGIGLFEEQLRDNLYRLWNRMSSGSYFPGPVRGVEIPKDHGEGVPLLGVPNTGDRVAQTAAAMLLEQKLEPVFHRDSYGYRPGRSAHDALAVCRRRCWTKDWVLDLDVRAFFDSVPHSLLLKAVAHHTSERWVLLYISRWLTAPMQMPDGTMVPREKGTPQGGLCSAEHKPPYEQCRVMRSAGLLALVTATAGGRALRITLPGAEAHRLASQLSSPGSWFHSGRSSVTMSV